MLLSINLVVAQEYYDLKVVKIPKYLYLNTFGFEGISIGNHEISPDKNAKGLLSITEIFVKYEYIQTKDELNPNLSINAIKIVPSAIIILIILLIVLFRIKTRQIHSNVDQLLWNIAKTTAKQKKS